MGGQGNALLEGAISAESGRIKGSHLSKEQEESGSKEREQQG